MSALDLSKKIPYLLVDFAYGDGYATHERYTTYSTDVDFGGDTYTSLRSMEIELPNHTGGTESTPCKIEVPLQAGLFTRISNGLPHSPVKVTIRKVVSKLAVDTATGDTVTFFAFRGEVKRVFRHINGRSDAIRMECLDVKAALSSPTGLPVIPTCRWTFASESCGVTVPPALILTGKNVSAIEGTKVTIDVFTIPDVAYGDAYRRGYLERDGLRIGIRVYTRGNGYVHLDQQPPSDWLNQTVTVFPGCVKTLAACTAYGNVGRNGAFGAKLPDFHPIYEEPQ